MKRHWMLLALLLAGPSQGQDAAQKVVDCMRANVPEHLAIKSLELTAYDRTGGTRTLKGRLYIGRERAASRDHISAALFIDLPIELKGAAYLVKETDDYLRDGMFVFLPAVKRVRRITGTFADGALLGTNISYFDFKQLQNAFSDVSAKDEGMADVNGRPAHVLSYTIVPGAETRYTGGRIWVDKEACVVVKGEFQASGGKVAKSFTSPPGALRKTGAAWYLADVEMQEPATGTRTTARITKVDTAGDVPKRYFDPNLFYLNP
jgi:Outer membrane lipoprotein-sorting protein